MSRPFASALVALVAILGLGSLGACTSSDSDTGLPEERAATTTPPNPGATSERLDPGASTEPLDSGRSDLPALTAPMRVAEIRWARGNVPRTVPEPDVALPSLLDDPPGRALVASYVPRPALDIDDEAIEFYGVDGRWRRLDLGDLDLPQNSWSGGDTYGAGALSPDGRWWAGPMINGMFLVDLRDGSTTVRQDVQRGLGVASFDWSPDSDELVLILSAKSTRVSLPDLQLESFPRPNAYPGILADGGWVECPHLGRIITQCNTYEPDGTLVQERPIPEDLKEKWAGPWWGPLDERDTSLFYDLPGKNAVRNSSHDWEILRTDAAFQANARLTLPAKSQIDSVDVSFNDETLGLAALDERLLLAWLVDEKTIVRVIQPGIGLADSGQDFWDVSYARDLTRIR